MVIFIIVLNYLVAPRIEIIKICKKFFITPVDPQPEGFEIIKIIKILKIFIFII